MLFPSIDTKDIWVRADNDERYIIDSYEVVASYRGLPLVANATLKLAPATDIVYSVPIEEAPEVVVSEGDDGAGGGASPETCGPTKGLDATYEDWS